MRDSRILLLAELLIAEHMRGHDPSDIPESVREVAETEAALLVKLFDDLRPPDIAMLADRQVERVSAAARLRQQSDTIEVLKRELEMLKAETSEKYAHLKSGLQWAIEILTTRHAVRRYDTKDA